MALECRRLTPRAAISCRAPQLRSAHVQGAVAVLVAIGMRFGSQLFASAGLLRTSALSSSSTADLAGASAHTWGISAGMQEWRYDKPRLPRAAKGDGRGSGELRDLSNVALLVHPDEGLPGFMQVAAAGGLIESESTSWTAAADQLARRVAWDIGPEEQVEFRTIGLQAFCDEAVENPAKYGIVLGVDLLSGPPSACTEAMRMVLSAANSRTFITSSQELAAQGPASFWRNLIKLGGVGIDSLSQDGPLGSLAGLAGGWSSYAKLQQNLEDLWHRRTAEEAVYAILVLIDEALQPLESIRLQNPVPTFESLNAAIGNCQDEFRGCFTTPRCMQSLVCLSGCGMADQSCSYRCIVSYQTDAFTQFSLCALQKNNLLNSQVKRPALPEPQLMETFRGAPLTEDVAEDILVGHYNPGTGKKFSWLVAAGSNPAYEQFALQHQLWYRGANGKSFWYHPTFLVESLDGQKIWRDRDYRVRRAGKPGLWDFSVLDNGITSDERWHLLGADEDLEWIVLFYIGVAKKAGLTYRGCLILTPDGSLPESTASRQAVMAAVARASLQPWELEAVANPPIDPKNPPPLIAPESQPAAPLLRVEAV
mmetsp:Transcript_64474/g.153926  ORF Transcript_64474/g.153926 Transcript_64474/m.153926 type:complete len:594 (+) Transcript_64474:69-1850(+)